MTGRTIGPRRLAASAALVALGLALAGLGQASASHVRVEAGGNLVWSRAWADSPPEPPAPAVTITWAEWFVGHHHQWLRDGSSTMGFRFPLPEPQEDVTSYTLVFVSELGTAEVPASGLIQHVGGTAYVHSLDGHAVKDHLVGGELEPHVPYAFVVEVHRPDGSVVARSATFWLGCTEAGSVHLSVTEPEGWAPY